MGDKCTGCKLYNTCAGLSTGNLATIQFPCKKCIHEECPPLKEPCSSCSALHYFAVGKDSIGKDSKCNFREQI